MATDLHVAFWCHIGGSRYEPGQRVTVEDDDKAAMLIQDGLCRLADEDAGSNADEDPGSKQDAGVAPAPTPAPTPAPASGENGGDGGGGAGAVKPSPAAPKPAWVDYAISQGMPASEARAASKTALIAKYDPAPDPAPGDPE